MRWSRFLIRRHRKKQVEQPVIHAIVREIFDLRLTLAPHHVDRALYKIAHHRLDVAPDVADFGELRCFNLDERCAREFREPARYLGFADTGWTDENDVVRRYLLANRFR